jgi:hypothetical protein
MKICPKQKTKMVSYLGLLTFESYLSSSIEWMKGF